MSAGSLSVVIPTWNEADGIAAAVLRARALGDEVIVTDGGSTDDTRDRAAAAGATVVVSKEKGRGPQLDLGARASRGDTLLFLHADAALPPEARRAIDRALSDPRVGAGNFRLRFVPDSAAARLFSRADELRRRVFRVYYGDSALFVRRALYLELGGFRPLPILEDYELVRRLERATRTVYVRDVVVRASARRFEAAPLRTLGVWTTLQLLYSLGVHPARLARFYKDHRPRPREERDATRPA